MKGCIDCPLSPAEDHICRRGPDEDVLVVAERHQGHICEYTYTIKSIVVWDGVGQELADEAYRTTKSHLPHSGVFLKRRCAQNSTRNCECQGQMSAEKKDKAGVSFSFGCSWSTYTQGMKIATEP